MWVSPPPFSSESETITTEYIAFSQERKSRNTQTNEITVSS